MTAYNIYPYANAEENVPVLMTIVLNRTDTDIVSIESDDPEAESEANVVLRQYMDAGLSAVEAVARYSGSYGEFKEANPDGSLVAPSDLDEPVGDRA